MYDLKAQYLLEGIEIAIAVQEFVFRLQTESGNQTINRLPNRIAPFSQVAIIVSGSDGKSVTTGSKNLKVQELTLRAREGILVPDALQHFTKDEIR
jgi:autotransporter translocation and assembly factor TamB